MSAGQARAGGGEGTPLLAVRDLAISFESRVGPRVRAVDGLSLTIHRGQTVALVGESGCGKSVSAMGLLRLLASPPARYERGRAAFDAGDGRTLDLMTLPAPALRDIRGGQIAMIFQEPMTSLNPVMSIGEQIIEAVRLHRGLGAAPARAAAVGALEEVGIAGAARRLGAYPHQFSGGMRQRVMIAMALACRPRLLLADEPTTALDVTIAAQILELLDELKAAHEMGVLLITHDLGVVAQHADVVCVMYAGRVVEYASVRGLFASPLHPYTRGLLGAIPRLGERRTSLAGVGESAEWEREFQAGAGPLEGLRPWWPRHVPPGDVLPSGGADTTLAQVLPGHWVALWRTPGAAHMPAPEPDLHYREASAGASA